MTNQTYPKHYNYIGTHICYGSLRIERSSYNKRKVSALLLNFHDTALTSDWVSFIYWFDMCRMSPFFVNITRHT